jgi:hypothetical protein
MALHLILRTIPRTRVLPGCLGVCLAAGLSAACEGDRQRGEMDAAVQSNAGMSASAGTSAHAGVGGGGIGNAGASGASGASGTFGNAGNSGSVSIDPSEMLETCPDAPSRPQDGEWTTTGKIIETACVADFPLGATDTRFAQVTIKTSALDGRADRDLNLSTPDGESFRGYVSGDEAALSGPLENYPDKPLDVDIYLVFKGYCFIANVKQVVQASSGPCAIKTYLVGKLVGS